jgi:hypothetical protein
VGAVVATEDFIGVTVRDFLVDISQMIVGIASAARAHSAVTNGVSGPEGERLLDQVHNSISHCIIG